MQVLTAEFPPTSGDATLAGFSVSREPEKTRRRVGYCPQFDAHFTNMTGREHVELYASIKGVPSDMVKEASAMKLAEVGLSEEDSDRLSAGYSGGMKRRLSLACATIGQPQIVFLDECSTGVDPVARREIWQMISDPINRRMNDARLPPRPTRKPEMMITKLQMLGDVKRKETQYVKEAAAGPKSTNKHITPPTMPLSVVVSAVISKANIKITVIQSGNW